MPINFEQKPSLVAYVTCGDPDLPTTREIIFAAIKAGANTIELGVPFSDPVADGPVIQRASERALKHNTSLEQVLKLAAEIREHSQSTGLVIFHLLESHPPHGDGKVLQSSTPRGNRWRPGHRPPSRRIRRIRPLPPKRMTGHHLSRRAYQHRPAPQDDRRSLTGFVYAVSRTGVTGARKQMSGRRPGFSPPHPQIHQKAGCRGLRHLHSGAVSGSRANIADACVIGSAIVETIERNPGKEAAVCGTIHRAAVGRWSLVAGLFTAIRRKAASPKI